MIDSSQTSPRIFERTIEYMLGNSPAHFAADVRQLSDYYIAFAGGATPWHEPFARAAYLAYFLPLNFRRLAEVWAEARRFGIVAGAREIWDLGSGIGTLQWVLEEDPSSPRPYLCVEQSSAAIAIHREFNKNWLGDSPPRWRPEFVDHRRPGPGALGVFSYSWLEMPNVDLEVFDHLLIVEPSTSTASRALMAKRSDLIARGYNVLAPCTHHDACPLLIHSKRDWCHRRTSFEPPPWWEELEAELPMVNRTLTYSYLLASRTIKADLPAGAARVIGDTLKENGKTRQLICRGPRREFLSWLHREGAAPRLPQGTLLDDFSGAVVPKGDELRVAKDSALVQLTVG